MASLIIDVDGPLDLQRSLSPLVRGNADRTIRLARDRAWWTTRTSAGAATVALTQVGGRVEAEAWGPGADEALGRVPDLFGPSTDSFVGDPDARVGRLARQQPGIRILRTGSVFDALVAAILEQKVTDTEAHRAWNGLVRMHGEPAPGPSDTGLRMFPAPATLAALPYWAYHEIGLERRRADLIRTIAARPRAIESITGLTWDEARARLVAVPGIGPWTAAEVAFRALGDVDAVSVGDFHLPNLVAWALAGEPRADDARMLALLEPFRGRRALVIRLLESASISIPRYGPRLAPRRIEGI